MDLKFAGLYLSNADLLEVHRRSQAQDRRHVKPAQLFQLEVYFARFFCHAFFRRWYTRWRFPI